MRSTLAISSLFFISLISLAGIETEKIAEGEEGDLAWSIHQVRTGSDGKDVNLMVILQNTGAKWIDVEGIDASSFSLTTRQGEKLKVQSATGFKGIPNGAFTIGHLTIERLGEFAPISISGLRLELKKKPDVLSGAAFVAAELQFDGRSRVAQIMDGLGHMPSNSTEFARLKERIEELKGIDSVAPLLWDYIDGKIKKRISSIGLSNGLEMLGAVPGGRDYKEPVKEMIEKHYFKVNQLLSQNELNKEQRIELNFSESIVGSGIQYFREPEDITFIEPFLKSTEPSIVSRSISWMAGHADKDAIVILENYANPEGQSDYLKDRAINAIRNIERRFGLPIRPAPPAGAAP